LNWEEKYVIPLRSPSFSIHKTPGYSTKRRLLFS
jgi:hypothetical protein